MKRAAVLIKTAVPFIWLGMVLGISFMEAPLKFTAPGITRSLGLGIGRIIFAALNTAEWVWITLLVISSVVYLKKISWGFSILLLVILLTQTFWLLPALDSRTEIILAGGTPQESLLHEFYIGIEILKAISLLVLGIFNFNSTIKDENL